MAVKREKVVQTAEKYVQRGKIDAAIREYRKVLAETPDDATTLNRVGDLYARTERPDEAIKLFTQIAENYTADGFFPKATAIYKKIIKLDPTRLEVYEKLAELYHRQGLLTEARTQYQVLADYYLKHDNSTSAISIYERMAQVDPDDPSLRVHLAELYQQGKLLDKAMAQYRRIAELMLSHGHADEAEQVLLKGLDVDAEDEVFIRDGVLKLKEAGQVGAAARFLAAAVEQNPAAADIAREVGVEATPESADAPAAEAAPQAQAAPPATEPAPPATEPAPPATGAEAVAPEPEEDVDLVLEMDEEPDLAEAMEDAAQAFGGEEAFGGDPEAPASGSDLPDLDRAAADFAGDEEEEPGEITLDLDFELDLEDDETPSTLVQPPADLLEADAAAAPAAEPDVAEPEPEPEAALEPEAGPVPEEVASTGPRFQTGSGMDVEISESGDSADFYPPDVELPEQGEGGAAAEDEPDGELDLDFLERTAAELHPERMQQEEDLVTEAEVLIKYGLTEKAMERLGELMQLNPQHPGGMGLLIRLHLDEGQYDGAAELATELCQLAPRSEVWQDLWVRLERTGFDRTEEGIILPPGALEEDEDADTAPALEVETGPEPAAPSIEALEGDEDAWAEAERAAREAEKLPLGDLAAELNAELAGTPSGEAAPSGEVAPPPEEAAPEAAAPGDGPPAAPTPSRPVRRPDRDVDDMLASLAAEVLPSSRRRPAAPAGGGEAAAPPSPPTPSSPSPPPSAGEAAAPPSGEPPAAEPSPEWLEQAGGDEAGGGLFSEEDDFFDLAAELEEELSREGELEEEDDLLLEQPREQSLEEIVAGFKQGVAEHLSEEDHNTHFDLGIAYREMGLLDEAIGEFQVAAKSPALLVECCSMLGLSFLEKGLPELAIKWYRRGLDAVGTDEEKQLGLLYDLGNAYMAMGEREEAHRTFVDLYGTNSNYRDVVAKLEETRAR